MESIISENIILKRPHVGFLDGNRITITSIKNEKASYEYKIEIRVSARALSKIQNIHPDEIVIFEIKNMIHWKVKVNLSGVGATLDINKEKEKQIWDTYAIIKVIN